MKRLFVFIASLFIFMQSFSIVEAIEDPTISPNNKFGIHIIEESDLENASYLINSSGGDWGYVTVVIPQTDRDYEKWQRIFDKMANLHLIPLVRIASIPENTRWTKLTENEISGWVSFLTSLRWPTKNRYVIIGNEPNHAKEWGGDINPGEYASLLKNTSMALKASSEDFFVLPAGLDASAPNLPGLMSEEKFLALMLESEPQIFDYIDGLTSHSYPNPGFSGSEKDTGRGSIRTFEWELNYLKELGVTKTLPVFITETGWIHNLNGRTPFLINTDKIGERLKYAFESVWSDPNIIAVTPFVLNYNSFPFQNFSWIDLEGEPYSFYNEVRELPKTAGQPVVNTESVNEESKFTPPPKLDLAILLYGISFNSSVNNYPTFGKI